MNEPRVYKHSVFLPIIFLLLFLFIGTVLFFNFNAVGGVVVVPLMAVVGLVFGIATLTYLSKTIISDDEISTQNIFGLNTLRWSEIRRVSGRGYRIKLHNFDEDVTVSPSPEVPGYEEIIEVIGAKRPDLFSPMEYNEMRRGAGSIAQLFIVMIIVIGMVVGFMVAISSTSDTSTFSFFPLVIMVIVILVVGALSLSAPRSISLDGNTLTLKYLFNEKNLTADEISSVQFSFTRTRNGKHYFVALNLANRKTIRVSGLSISLPVAYLVLKNWLKNNKQGQSRQSMPDNIAPNWSDNSWN